MAQQVEYMQVPNGTEPGVWRSKRPVSAMLHPSHMFHGNLSYVGKISSSVIRSRIGIKSDR